MKDRSVTDMSNNSEFCSKLCGKDCKVSLLHAKEIQGVTNKESPWHAVTNKEFVWSRSLFRAVRSLGFDSATKAMSELAQGSDRLRLETSVVSLRLAIFASACYG